MILLREERINFDDKWKEYFDNCDNFLSDQFRLVKSFLIQYQTKSNKLSLEKELRSIQNLNNTGVSDELIRQILEIERLINKAREEGEKQLEAFLNLVSSSKSEATSSQQRADFYNPMQKSLNMLNSNSVLYFLARVHIALELGNQFQLKKAITNLINIDKYQYSFTVYKEMFKNVEQEDLFRSVFIDIVARVSQSLNDKNLFHIFVNHYSQILDEEKFDSLSALYKTDWSLSQIRELSNKANYGVEFTYFWSRQLRARTTNNEVFVFLQNAVSHKDFTSTHVNNLWIFRDFFPASNKIQSLIEENIKGHMKKSNDYIHKRYLMINLSLRDSIKKILQQVDDDFGRAEFQIFRAFYRDLLRKGIARDYALFRLVEMDDFDEIYFWWLVL